jgi:hypothetical protein
MDEMVTVHIGIIVGLCIAVLGFGIAASNCIFRKKSYTDALVELN